MKGFSWILSVPGWQRYTSPDGRGHGSHNGKEYYINKSENEERIYLMVHLWFDYYYKLVQVRKIKEIQITEQDTVKVTRINKIGGLWRHITNRQKIIGD